MEWIKFPDKKPYEGRKHNWHLVFVPSWGVCNVTPAVFNHNDRWMLNGDDITEIVTHFSNWPEPPKD